MKYITNKQFRKAMKEAGLENVNLDKDCGCFAISSDDVKTDIKISLLDSPLIMLNSFKDQGIKEWIKDIKKMLDSIPDEEVERVINYDLDKVIIN